MKTPTLAFVSQDTVVMYTTVYVTDILTVTKGRDSLQFCTVVLWPYLLTFHSYRILVRGFIYHCSNSAGEYATNNIMMLCWIRSQMGIVGTRKCRVTFSQQVTTSYNLQQVIMRSAKGEG